MKNKFDRKNVTITVLLNEKFKEQKKNQKKQKNKRVWHFKNFEMF